MKGNGARTRDWRTHTLRAIALGGVALVMTSCQGLPNWSLSPSPQGSAPANPGAQSSANPSANPTASSSASPTASPAAGSSPSPGASLPPHQQLEGSLTKLLEQGTGVLPQKVTCPEKETLKPGDRFDCEAMADGQTFAIAVEITDDKGQFKFNWTSKNLLLLSKMESFIAERLTQQAGAPVKVNCGGKLRRVTAGDRVKCKVTDAQGQEKGLTIVVKDEQGQVEIEFDGATSSPTGSPTGSPSATPSGSQNPGQ